jgi:hypothetical protein
VQKIADAGDDRADQANDQQLLNSRIIQIVVDSDGIPGLASLT